jgi:hypothetical protein
MPAQPVDYARSLADQVFAVVDQQPHLAFVPIEPRDRQVGLAQGSAGDGERVDSVGLPERARTSPRIGHQLRRHPDDPFASGEQIPLKTTRQVPAVFDRPAPLVETGCPANKLEMIRRHRSRRALRKLPSLPIDRNDRVAALVSVDPKGHHKAVSPSIGGARPGSVGGHIPVGATARSSQATPAGPTIAARAAQLKPATKAIKNLERARTADSL